MDETLEEALARGRERAAILRYLSRHRDEQTQRGEDTQSLEFIHGADLLGDMIDGIASGEHDDG